MFRQMAVRKGFTDRQIEDGEIYEATLLDMEQPMKAIVDDYLYNLEQHG